MDASRTRNSGTQQSLHEEATILAFIQPDKRKRFLTFLASPKNRKKFTSELAHFHWIDRRFAVGSDLWKADPKLKPSDRNAQGIENIFLMLRSRGAKETCWIMSEDSNIDGREMELRSALEYVVGRGVGAILSCVPGRLGYFEDEDERLLLVRNA